MAKDQDDASFAALFTNERYRVYLRDKFVSAMIARHWCGCLIIAVPRSYEKRTFRAGSTTLQLLCSESASSELKTFLCLQLPCADAFSVTCDTSGPFITWVAGGRPLPILKQPC